MVDGGGGGRGRVEVVGGRGRGAAESLWAGRGGDVRCGGCAVEGEFRGGR